MAHEHDRGGLRVVTRSLRALAAARTIRFLGAAAVSAAVGLPIGAGAASIKEYVVPTPHSGPLYIAAGGDGALWFTEYLANKIGRITTLGVFSEFVIPTADSSPHGVTVGRDAALWFTETAGNKIGRITTSKGDITEFTIPTTESVPNAIALGPDGALWFSDNKVNANAIVRMTPAGVFASYPMPKPLEALGGITVGSDNALWVTMIDSNKIAQITTEGVISNEFHILTEANVATEIEPAPRQPSIITPGPDGALWFVEVNANKIGRITTAGAVTEYDIPTKDSGPNGITAGPDDALWFTEFNASKIGRITTAGVVTDEIPTPTANSHPASVTVGGDGALWFTEVDANKIGRVDGIIPTVSKPGDCLAGAKCDGR
jgi:virginiamycin B lyase